DRLFRHRRGYALAQRVSPPARRFVAATLGGNGTNRGDRNAALAPSIHGRRPGRYPRVVRLPSVFENDLTNPLTLNRIPVFLRCRGRFPSFQDRPSPCQASKDL